jgi:hypothetical protein
MLTSSSRYAEILEDTQHILIATVRKLYFKARNGESWDLGDPELDDSGLPVIHDIAEKLGCIRPPFDLAGASPVDADGFSELQVPPDVADELQGNLSQYPAFSSEVQLPWVQQQPQQDSNNGLFDQPSQVVSLSQEPQFGKDPNSQNLMILDLRLIASLVNPNSQAPGFSVESPIFDNSRSFSPSLVGEDHFSATGYMLTMRKTHQHNSFQEAVPQSENSAVNYHDFKSDIQRAIQQSSNREGAPGVENLAASFPNVAIDTTCLNRSDGNIKEEMPDCFMGFDVAADIG